MDQLICVLIGVLAGSASGLFGIGGGILIVPLLILAFKMEFQRAAGTSLAILLIPVGVLAVKNYWDKQAIDVVKGAWIALGFVGGAFLGSKLALGLDPVVMRKAFSIFLACVSVYLFFKN